MILNVFNYSSSPYGKYMVKGYRECTAIATYLQSIITRPKIYTQRL